MIIKKNQSNLILRVLLCVMWICTLVGALFCWKGENVSVKAELKKTDITDTIALENRTWGALEGEYYFGVSTDGEYLNTADNVSGCWYLGREDLIANNNGIDITEYIHVNGKSAKQWITENTQLSTPLVGDNGVTTTAWLSNAAASPIYVQTSTATGNMGLEIRILKAAISEPFTVTFKQGFSVIAANGEVVEISDDVNFHYASGTLTKEAKYTLTFDGVESRRIAAGATVGELPAVPVREGKIGVWQIDGVDIKAGTVYNYGASKTATAFYLEGTDIADTLDMSNWGTAQGADCTYIRVGNQTDADNNFIIPTAFTNIHWQDGYMTQTVNNFGCDLMEYIYINGKSTRAISTENGQSETYGGEGKTTTFPFTFGGIYAPVDVYTNGNEFVILVMTDYVAKDELVITFKAGLRLASADGGMFYLSKDFVFPYYTVTFDGVVKKVNPNETVAEPVAPTKAETESHTYAFDGWYHGETKWDFATPVTENVNLTAKFTATEKAKYTVTFDADNGETEKSISVYVNACIKAEQIPANPEKFAEGALVYTFVFWSLDGENAYDFTTPITQEITLTAIYTVQTLYTVKTGDATQKVVAGEKAVEPAEPTKASTAEFDYTFDGWYHGETKWDFENDTVNENMELVAKFSERKRTYTINFVVTGNDAVTFAPVVVEYGTVYDLSGLLADYDVSGYTYSISVGGVEKISVKVFSDTTVNVVFTKKTAENGGEPSGCGSVLGGANLLLGAMALCVAAVIKKKEN